MKKKALATTLILLGSLPALADTHYHVGVDGIPCPFCLYGIEKNLGSLAGVTGVESDLAEGVFFVKVAEGRRLSKDRVREIVTSAGFTLRDFEEIDSAGEE